jgi:hypothetical protein
MMSYGREALWYALRDLKEGLTEEARYAVADHVVTQLKEGGVIGWKVFPAPPTPRPSVLKAPVFPAGAFHFRAERTYRDTHHSGSDARSMTALAAARIGCAER